MTLEQELRWLNSHVSFEAKRPPNAGDTAHLSVNGIRSLLTLLGDPHRDAPAVHLTGTNGKGSTSHMTSLILREHGLRVGTYASPHVSKINERIQIDVAPLDDESLAETLAAVRLAAAHLEQAGTWFDLLTAASFRAFNDAAVDAMVVEVGMLGRYDSTNVVDGSVSVITNVAKDHTDGSPGWRERIAAEKAGIVKPGSTLVIGDLDEDLHHWFIDEGPGAVLRLGSQFHLLSNELAVGGRVVDVRTPRDVYESVLVSLHGRHQGTNAALAIATAEAFLDAPLDHGYLQTALGQASIPGRCEVLGTDPLIVVDGAHNPHGAAVAARTFDETFHTFGRRILVVGMMNEKDPVEMLEALEATEAEIVICCQPDWPRAMPVERLAAAARSLGLDPETVTSAADAVDVARSLAEEGDAIFVAGSLYVAGAVRNRLLNIGG